MSDRRRAERVLIGKGITGVVSLRQDVVVERISAVELTVVSEAAVARGEQLALEIQTGDGVTERCVTRVIERRPALMNGRACHRLSLRVLDAARNGLGTRLQALLTPLPAVSIQRIDVRLVDVSSKGYQLRSNYEFGEDTVGLLHVSIDGRVYTDAMRVSRATAVQGGVGHRAAGQFLPISPASIRSVRWLAEWLGKTALASQSHALVSVSA